ncbi:MAG TPA: YihY/virulence factor BrkB family protein [Acidimicrobiales bacterium]
MADLFSALLRPLPPRARAMVGELVQEWRDDRVSGLAAEVAFFGLLSLFPTLLAMTAALGSLESIIGADLAQRAERAVIDFLQRFLTEDAADTTAAVRELFTESSTGTLTFGVVFALWAASRGFTALVNGLDVVYDLEERRGYVRLRLLALALALGTVVVVVGLLAMVIIGPLLGSGQAVADWLGAGDQFAVLWDWARWPVIVVVLVLWAVTLFHLAPNHRTPWRADVPGALVTATLWALLSLGFRAYLALAPGANQVFGSLGGALIVLLWIYLLALGLLVGGEVNAILLNRQRESA